MLRDVIVKGRTLGGSSDLTLLAPIKPGFVESLESVTYKTRVKRVLETLHAARKSSHEHALARLLSDAVERVGAIQSVRVAVLEPEDKVMLVVTFDGSWDSYIRVLWDKVGTLLDLIFCGTVDYVTSRDHTFEEWAEWAARVQIESGFFYGPPDSTARDMLYHRQIERTRQRGLGTELQELRSVLPSAEQAVDVLTRGDPIRHPDDSPAEASRPRMGYERLRTGFQALAALYRLTDLFRPGTVDGPVLRFASIRLLREFVVMWNARFAQGDFDDARGTSEGGSGRFKRQLDWLLPESEWPIELGRTVPTFESLTDEIAADVQGGILQSYANVTHGVVLMFTFENAVAASRFLALTESRITSHRDATGKVDVFRNLALTLAGLRACGLSEEDIDLFPEDFRQGMAERAGLLGDVRSNHPRRWRLPKRYDAAGSPDSDAVELATVHAVLQLRCAAPGEEALKTVDVAEAAHPLRAEVEHWSGHGDAGIHLLAVQSLKRQVRQQDGQPVVVEHFGYADGGSDPEIDVSAEEDKRVHFGEFVLGHSNAADTMDDEVAAASSEVTKARLGWTNNGSFLVMRKYRQYVERLETAVKQAVDDMAPKPADAEACIDEVYAKLMGRDRRGRPVIPTAPTSDLNDFDYEGDPQGQACPLHAHIRRANPRLNAGTMARPPRLMRRSMPYGPGADAGEADRGLLFMAYNASFSEQFEVVQRWLAGGNSTGASSGQSCPIVGVPENGFPRHFRFERDDHTIVNVELDGIAPLFEEPEPITRLEWGMYLFSPSLTALRRLNRTALASACGKPTQAVPWRVAKGRKMIAGLKDLEVTEGASAAVAAWKAAIEDLESIDRLDSAALWAAIREDHGGLLRTPYGVLVARRELISQVFLDKQERYSVSGQMERMRQSIGEISLGNDAGREYDDASIPINEAISQLDPQEVFDLARNAADRKICKILHEANKQAAEVGNAHHEVGFDAREVVDEVLADLCEAWFGLQGSDHFRRGSTDWAWTTDQPPLYPGHFTALSRYMFQPNPGATPVELGQSYGRSLRSAMLRFVQDHRSGNSIPRNPQGRDAPIAAATFNHRRFGSDDVFVARTMVGVLMGFTPTIIGAVLNVLREWHRDGTFWSLRTRCATTPIGDIRDASDLIHAPMAAAAQMRPMPQIGWRTARKSHRLGTPGQHVLDIEVGDKIVMAVVSGTQESLAQGQPDGRLMFGGDREMTPHPTHACPGYHAGIAAMLGTLTALISRPENLRPGVSPLTFEVRSKTLFERSDAVKNLDVEALERQQLELETCIAFADVVEGTPEQAFGSKGLILAWGDSWLDYREFIQNTDITNCLHRLGYVVNEGRDEGDRFCNYQAWLMLQTMAADIRPPAKEGEPQKEGPKEFLKYIDRKLKGNPRAILLSGGGNDSVEGVLKGLLEPRQPDLDPVNSKRLESHVAQLLGFYVTIVEEIWKRVEARGIPILVHGYDYPVPFYDVFANTFGRRKWLQEPFLDRGYKDPQTPDLVDLKLAIPAMVTVIDALNKMLKDELTKGRSYVKYVDLRGTMKPQWEHNDESGWRDNLHPNATGFGLVAGKIAGAVEIYSPVPNPPVV